MLSKWNLMTLVLGMAVIFSGCSSMYKQRQEERNKVANSSGFYCEFVNGDANNDVDVEMNIQMAKKCDTSKPFSITNYKNASDIFGVIYCCAHQKGKAASAATSAKPATNSPSSANELE